MLSVLISFGLAFFVSICKHMKWFYPLYWLVSQTDFSASFLFCHFFVILLYFILFSDLAGLWLHAKPVLEHTHEIVQEICYQDRNSKTSFFLCGFLCLFFFWPQGVFCVAHSETKEVHSWKKSCSTESAVLLYFFVFCSPFREKK